jgi:CBS domain-containing protein
MDPPDGASHRAVSPFAAGFNRGGFERRLSGKNSEQRRRWTMNVEDVMRTEVQTVRPETLLKDVAALLARHRIGGVPVIDGERVPIGVVSKHDIVVKESGTLPQRRLRDALRRRGPDPVAAKVSARTAGEAMSTPAITIEPLLPLSLAVERMLASGVNRLPVVSRGTLVGILTRHDLVRAFARGDGEIEREIRREALTGLSWADEVDVAVRDGEVTLRGQVDTVYDAQALPVAVRHILGVVSVDAELNGWDPQSKRQIGVASHL